MKHTLLLIVSCLLCLIPKVISAQAIPAADLQDLKEKVFFSAQQTGAKNKYNTKGAGNLLLTFYQKFLSRQISAECIFRPSCSGYSRAAINKYGLLKGVLMTGDRLTRCNGISARDIPSFKFNDEGHAHDQP